MAQARKPVAGTWVASFETPAGPACAAGRGSTLLRVVLPGSGGEREALEDLRERFPGARTGGADARSAAEGIAAFLLGEGRAPRVLLEDLSPFRREALRRMAGIRRGTVATYGAVAAWIGRPGAARAVGGAAAANPVPLAVPCHRVVGADGSLTGFSSPGGLEQKRRLLEAEGVGFLPGFPPRVRGEFLRRDPPS